MRHEIRFTPEWVEVRTSGKASFEGFVAFGEAVAADPRWRPGLRVLIDHSDLDMTELSAAVIAHLGARADGGHHPIRGFERCAFVAPAPLNFAFGRMWGAYSGRGDAPHVRLFRHRDEAEAWLREGSAARVDRTDPPE